MIDKEREGKGRGKGVSGFVLVLAWAQVKNPNQPKRTHLERERDEGWDGERAEGKS